MAIIEVTVCDVCRSPDRGDTTQFHISEAEQEPHLVVLCESHAAPLRELMRYDASVLSAAEAPKVAATKPPPRRRKRNGFNAIVTTVEEIEASKEKP